MSQYNVHSAKTHFSKLLDEVEAGREVIIARAGRPVAKLVPIVKPNHRHEPGSDRGRIWVADDFDAPLPADVQKYFE